MDLLDEDEVHIKAEDLSDFEDEAQIEAIFFPNSLLHELKDENQMEAEVFSTSEMEMERNASTQQGLETLSDKSYNRYLSAYEVFKKWQESKEINSVTEPVLLDYFHELSTKYSPSSLSLCYTMLKSTILYHHKINISEYSQLIQFVNMKADKIQRKKKGKVFTADDVKKFLVEAPDYKYLAMKVVLVFGVIGSCSIESISYIKIEHVKDNESEIIVRIRDTKTKVAKTHVIDGLFAEIVRTYLKVRPRTGCTDKFVMQYRDGKCINKAMGKNTLTKVPKEVAKFLKLPEPKAYTGYSFRITSRQTSRDTSAALQTRLGQCKPSTVAQENVQESLGHERKMIAEELNFTSTSNVTIASHENESVRIRPANITSSESPSHVYEVISDESTGDIPENNSLSENEVENFGYPPPNSYFKHTDAYMREALTETLPNKKSDTFTQETLETLSDRSYKRYVYIYEMFKKWQESKEVNSFAEPVLLDFFRELSTKYKPSSLWNLYAMLKSTILRNHSINIYEYSQLIAFLKEKADGFQCKKSKVFTADDVNKFLVEAPDDEYLAMKTVLVFVLSGACSGCKVTNVKIDQVRDNGNEIIVRIPDAKTNLAKPYIIDGQFAELVRKYMKLRPRTACTQRFFIHYRNGKCTDQVMGRDKILKMPKEIANFLKLPETEAYTGNSFRSNSIRISADTGIAIEALKRHGQQRCSRVAEEHLQRSSGYQGRIRIPI